ncbi:pilus assembly protein PilP [Myxococcota bacterium]|nr:pilus assembly protein PilP [Myxococcota bacterium]
MDRSIPLLLVGALLAGCDLLVDGSGTPQQAPTAPVATPPPVKELSELDKAIQAQDAYAYNPVGKRDPFRSFLASGEGAGDDVPTTPLQRYEVDQYQLVGIIWGIERPRALVQDPEGVGHVMEVGTYIGKNWGKVTRINANEVVVTEEYQNIRGDLIVNDIRLALPVTEG